MRYALSSTAALLLVVGPLVGCDDGETTTPDAAPQNDSTVDGTVDPEDTGPTPDMAVEADTGPGPDAMVEADMAIEADMAVEPDAAVCAEGSVGCPCGAGEACDPGGECVGGTCESCLTESGCTCVDICAGAMACEDGTCRPAVTCADLVCGRGRLCADVEGRDGACLDECEEGFAWNDVLRRCDEVETCASLDCAGQGRACDESGDQPVCGDCLDGFDEVGGECARVGGCDGPAGVGAMCEMLNRSCEEDGDGLGSCGPCDDGFFPDAADPDGACVAAGDNCDTEADCVDGLYCVQLQAPAGQVAPQGVCVAAPCPDGQVFDSTTGACAPVDGDVAARCAEQGALGVWPVTDFDGNPVCETAPGWFFDTTPAVRAAVPCDDDADGWIRRSAQAEIDSDDLARSLNARCDLRTVFAVALVNEWGQRREADLPDGLASVALYEPDSIDTPGDPAGLQELPHGARRFDAGELNPLTKGCVSPRTDLNANGLDDLVEHQGQLPSEDRLWMAPFVSFTHFGALYTTTYEPPEGALVHGVLVISARNRCSEFALGYQDDDSAWWRSCERRRDAGYGADGAGPGYDFAQYACPAERGACGPNPFRTGPAGDDGALAHGLCNADRLDDDPVAWRPLGHFSQFRCVQLVADAAETEAHELRHTDVYTGDRGVWQYNRCGLGADGAPLSCETDIGATLDDAQRGGATETLVGQVSWVARRFVPYPDVDGYAGGCVSEWIEAPELCGGDPDVAGASGAFGQVVCGCDGDGFELPLADNQNGGCAGNTKLCEDGRLVEPVPPLEVCDLTDTDCDGRVDENLTNRCGGCGPLPEETCNNLDDDCDGVTDEGFLINQRCSDGVGECRRSGFTICGENGDVVCEAIAANPQREGCDRGADFDCDGQTGEGTSEVCDGTDNDCDGFTDEEMVTDWSCAPSVRAVLVGQDIDGIFDPDDIRLMVAERSVRFDRDVLVSQIEETVANYREVANTYGWNLIAEHGSCQNRNEGNVCPAVLNWYTAVAYANGRSIAEGYDPCYRMVGCGGQPGANFSCSYVTWDETQDCSGYRLPTSSEWEYAARAGGMYDVSTGEVEILDVAWCDDRGRHYSACGLGVDHTWELCDVYGNLAEWIWDEYGPPPLDRVSCDAGGCSVANEFDYLGPGGDEMSGATRVLAGGHASTDDYACGPIARDSRSANAATNFEGLRLVRTANTENRNPEHLVSDDGASYDLDPLFDARGRAEVIFDIEAVGDADYFRFSLAEEAYVSIETLGLASSWTERNGNAIAGLVNPSDTGAAVQCDLNVALSLYRSGNAVRVEPAIATDLVNQGAGLCALIDTYDPRGDPGRSRLPAGEYQVKVEGINRAIGTARLVVRTLQVAREGESCSVAAAYPTYTGLPYPPCLDGLTCFEGSVIGSDISSGSLTDDKGICVSIEDLEVGLTDSGVIAGQLDVKRVVMPQDGRLGVEVLPPEGVNCTVQRDTELRIFRQRGNGTLVEEAYDDNGGLGFCSRVDVPVSAGTYFVAINAFDHQFDIDYRLRLGGTVCEANDDTPPCNGCPAGTEVPLGWVCAPSGGFAMGTPADENRRIEQPQHQVTLTRPYLMQATEVTRGSWEALMGTTPWTNPDGDPDNLFCNSGCPVYRVSWWEAAAYANALSRAEGLQECYDLGGNWLRWFANRYQQDGICADLHAQQIPVYEYIRDGEDYAVPQWWDLRCSDDVPFVGLGCTGYRLPTEAEWEHAARAGSDGTWFFGEDQNALQLYAWYRDSAGQRAHVVGELLPNPWGLYDIYGNVSEWVHDWQHGGRNNVGGYPGGDRIDPTGGSYPDGVYHRSFVRGPDEWYPIPRNDTDYYRVHRGGAFDLEYDPARLFEGWIENAAEADATRSATRHYLQPYYRMRTVGFRLVRTVQ